MPGPPQPLATATQVASAQAMNTSPAQAIGGTVATVAATPAGAAGVTLASNAGFAALGSNITGTPELPAIAWVVTFLFQGIKHISWIDQDKHKWIILPVMALLVGLGLFMLETHGDVWTSAAKAVQNAGLAAVNALTNYHHMKPMGIFDSAEEV